MKKLLSIALLALASAAQATIVQVAAPGALGPGPITLETFEGALGAGVTYSASSSITIGNAGTYASGGTASGTRGLSASSFPDPITLTFAAPTSSVGMYFGNDDICCSSGFTAYLDIFNAGGLIGTIGVEANMNDFADQFIGFTSDELVTKVTIRYGNGSDVGLYTFIDDVQFNVAAAPLPEPASLALAGAAMAAVAFVGRRRGTKGAKPAAN